MPLRRAAALLLALLLGASAPRAWAADGSRRAPSAKKADARKEKAARSHFQRAERAFNLGRFDDALKGYQAAHDALPLPAFLFNMAQCHRNLGNQERAIFFYQRYLSLEPNAPNRRVVEDLIAEQQRKLDAARAAAGVPGGPAAPAPTPDLTPRPAPDDAATHAAAPPAIAPDDRRKLSERWWVWAILGAVVAGGVAAAVMAGSGEMPKGRLGSIDAR